MSEQMTRQPLLSDDAIRGALRPGPDVAAPTDFTLAVARSIAGMPQHRRWWHVAAVRSQRQLLAFAQVLLLIAVLLALTIGAVIVGALLERRTGGGPLFVAQANQLAMIDPQTSRLTPVIEDARGIFGVARSTKGEFVSFWTGKPGRAGNTLELARADGSDRRILAANVTPSPIGLGSVDVWSGDDQYLAAGVMAGGFNRVLVVEIASGDGRLIGPDDGAINPIWSPNRNWIAFVRERRAGPNILAVMRPDGSDVRELTPDLGADVSGPTNWSADGTWIYFDAGGHAPGENDIYRADPETGLIQPLTYGETAAAPALSPDDLQVAFMVWTYTRTATVASVYVMGADGTAAHQLVAYADLRGWSSDGHYVLVVVRRPGELVELLAITPDGNERRVLLTLDSCPEPCLQNLSWGWPRP